MIILTSCSKREKFIDLNNNIGQEKTVELMEDSFGKLYSNSIDSSPEIDNKVKLLDFLEQPFVSENITIPNRNGYADLNALFMHLGNPISEYSIIKGIVQLEDNDDNYARNIEFEYYTIWALYTVSNDMVNIYRISIELKDEILYKYDIKKNDSPEKIKKIFGEPFRSGKVSQNLIDYSYFLGFDLPSFNFQFNNEKLNRIIFTLMY
jgi:hypothetical protein